MELISIDKRHTRVSATSFREHAININDCARGAYVSILDIRLWPNELFVDSSSSKQRQYGENTRRRNNCRRVINYFRKKGTLLKEERINLAYIEL